MNGRKVRDMTKGNPTEHILIFALPVFLGNIFQQLYNMVDSFVVGNYVGSNSLAHIGRCFSKKEYSSSNVFKYLPVFFSMMLSISD